MTSGAHRSMNSWQVGGTHPTGMFYHLCVILSTITGHMTRGVCIQEGLGRPPPPEIHGILQDTVNKRAVRILLECILVSESFWLEHVAWCHQSWTWKQKSVRTVTHSITCKSEWGKCLSTFSEVKSASLSFVTSPSVFCIPCRNESLSSTWVIFVSNSCWAWSINIQKLRETSIMRHNCQKEDWQPNLLIMS